MISDIDSSFKIETNRVRASEHTLRYNKEATCFNEALPLGNGRIGAMVYGGVCEETVSLNEDTFWSGYPKEGNHEDYPAVYREALRLFDEGKVLEAQTVLESGFGDYLVQMYLPLAELKLCMKHQPVSVNQNENKDEIKRYNRMLKLDRAVHSVSYVAEGKQYKRECFVSAPYQVMVMRLSCSEQAGVSFSAKVESGFATDFAQVTFEREKLNVKEDVGKAVAHVTYGQAPNAVAGYGSVYNSLESHQYDGKGVSFACAMGVKTTGGSVLYQDGVIEVQGADEAVIYVSIRTDFKGYNQLPQGNEYKEQCVSELKCAMEADYEDLKKQSTREHRSLYNRCRISIGKARRILIPTDERLKRLTKGQEDNALYALLFNYGKYLTIAGSRSGSQVMNLQGIWNDKPMPPWNCNYTLNINTEMNYWPTLGMGLFECYEPFIQFVEELAESGRKTAKEYYGADGWVCHHSSDVWRLTHPGTNRLPRNAQWGFWNMASGWLSVMLWNYYRYTLDVPYLKRIYPIMEGAAAFYRELLAECDGEVILPLSTSPENQYVDEELLAVDKSTAMTQEILYDLFLAVSEASKVLGLADGYEEVVSRLKRPQVQADGELCEWHKEHGVWDVHHRHVSHLYGLFPSNQFSEDDVRKEACRKVLFSRGDGGTGWALAWKINLWARLEDGEHALQLLNNQLRLVPAKEDGRDIGGGSYPNLLCAHPPFQIDGNFGAASGIMEMLVQCDKEGNPIFLPALPKAWDCGSVEGYRLPNGCSVSFTWEDGKIQWSSVEDKEN